MSRLEYSKFYETFEASELEAGLKGSLTEGLNACVECCDRHAVGDRVALYWE